MDFFEVLENPSMLHAAVVHTPIVLAMLGFPLLCLSALLPKNKTLRLVTIAVYGLFAASSFAAVSSGEDAYAKVPSNYSQEVWEQIDTHEALGVAVQYPAVITFVLLALTLVPVQRFQQVMVFGALASALTGAVLITITAHYGGVLVYRYGVGYLDEEAVAAKAPPPEEREEDWVPIRPIDLAEAEAVSYVRDVHPIFDRYCIDCHSGSSPDGDYDMSTVANMMLAGQKAGPGVIPGEPDESSIVQYIRGILQPRMPRRKPPMDEDLLHTIRLWIAAGAVDDGEAEAADPFAAPEPEEVADPFAAPEPEEVTDPFAAPEPEEVADPFAAPEPEEVADPFAAPEPEETADPFAAPEPEEMVDPFAAPEPEQSVDPFAA